MKLKARQENILVLETNGETLIYDLVSNKSYLLNETSAFVWNQCDGKTELREIAGALAAKNKQAINEEIVWLTINELHGNNLMAETNRADNPLRTLNRREAIKKVGLATMIALPLVTGLVAPQAANAQSGACGRSCTNSSICSAPCPTCRGLGFCGNVGSACTNLGGPCLASGTCQEQFGSTSGTCSVGGASCPNPGGGCTATLTCLGNGVCRA